MRRRVGIVSIAVLTAALFPAALCASTHAISTGPYYDLRPQLMMRLFGENGDTRASLAAAYGDRGSESPLRGLALVVAGATRPAAYAQAGTAPTFATAFDSDLGVLATTSSLERAVLNSAVRFTAPTPPVADPGISAATAAAPAAGAAQRAAVPEEFTVGNYQPEAVAAVVVPQPGAYSFGPLAVAPSRSTASNVRVGPVDFQGRVEGASAQTPAIGQIDNAAGAGANFDLRAGSRRVNVDISSGYEHLTRNDASGFSTSSLSSSWVQPGDNVPLVVPTYADMSRLVVGAAVAVPVVKGLTFNLNAGAQRLLGGSGTLPGLNNVDAINASYGGGFTYTIPKFSNGTLSLSAHQSRYQDNLVPLNTNTQTHEDLNLTVKF